MPDTIATQVLKRFDSLRRDRGTWENHWQEVAQVIAPRKATFLDDAGGTAGEKRMQKVYDSTGIAMNELLAAGLHGLATNPASRWFALRVLDEELMEIETVKEFLSDAEDAMFAEMHAPGSPITSHLHEVYLDAGAFGTGVMFIGEEEDEARPIFQARHLREVYIAEDPDGNYDTVFRCFPMSARNIKQQWPDVELKAVEKAISSQQVDQKFEVVHAVFPRRERDRQSALRSDLPWASIYVLKEGKEEIDVGGFEEFPYAILPFTKVAGEVYGRGPGMTALPDVKMLQEMMKVHLRAGQKLVDPPLLVNDDAVMGPVRTMTGGLNFLRPGGDIRPLVTNARLDLSFEMMQDVRNRIGQIFFADVVRPFTERTNETATEVMQRVQQQMRLLGPLLGRLESFLNQIVARVFGIMQRAGRFPDVPEELAGAAFSVEFVSPIATAQRGAEVETVMQWITMNAQFIQLEPEIARRMKLNELPQWSANALRIDPVLVADDEEVEEGQQQQQAAQIAQLAPAAKDGAAAVKSIAEAQALAQGG